MRTSQTKLSAMAPRSGSNRTMQTSKNEANAKLVMTSLCGKIITNKKVRRLQSMSISYCIFRQLKCAFTILKLLLTPRKKQSVQEWYRSRLLSSVFGCWLSFTRSEQAIDLRLSEKGKYIHDRKQMQKFISASVGRQAACSCLTKNMHLAVTYFTCLRQLECFEIFMGNVARKNILKSKENVAKKFALNRMKASCIGKKKR